MKNKALSINLIGKKKKFVDKFVDWALTVGRLVVILTEGIALATFLYRFSLDRQLIDLQDEITKKQAIVKYLKSNEEKYRDLQGRLFIAKEFIDNSPDLAKNLSGIINLAPNDLLFKDIAISENNIKIDATLRSVSSLSRFIKSIKAYNNVEQVSLDKIDNKPSNSTITVSITVSFKKQNKVSTEKI